MFFRFKNTAKNLMLKRQKLIGFSDLLNYLLLLDEQTVLHKDGGMSTHFIINCPDIESATKAEADFNSETWKQALAMLTDGWMLELNVCSEKLLPNKIKFYDEKEYNLDDVSDLFIRISSQKYLKNDYFNNKTILTISYRTNDIVEERLRKFALQENSSDIDYWQQQLNIFYKTVNKLIGFLQRVVIKIEPLKNENLLGFLYQTITGKNQKIACPYIGSFLNSYLVTEDFIGGLEPKIGNKYIKVIAINELPEYSYPAILELINYFNIEYRFNSRVVRLDKNTANNYLKKYQKNWSSKAIGFMGVIRESFNLPVKIDEDAQSTADQISDSMVKNSSEELTFSFYNSSLILFHEDQNFLLQTSQNIIEKISQLNFRAKLENINAVEAYLGSIPAHGDYNLRKILVDSTLLSHILPVTGIYQGQFTAPCKLQGYNNKSALLICITKGSRPFALNLHVNDVGHTLILGPTGSGKTTLLGSLITAHRQYSQSRIIVFDKDNSNKLLLQALNGEYISFQDNNFQLSPLLLLDESRILSWLISIVELQNINLTSSMRRELLLAVRRLKNEDDCYQNLNHLFVEDEQLRLALSQFNSGNVAAMLNGVQKNNLQNNVIGFAMENILKQHNYIAFPVIQAIFFTLENLFFDKKPTLLILEEAWLYLKHDLLREQLINWLKTLRKFNVSIIFVSQDIEDITNSSATATIQSSCMTRIFLPNKSANQSDLQKSYKRFGLNEKQINIIAQSIPKQDYYYQSSLGNRLFSLDLNDLSKAFLCINKTKDLEYFQHIYAQKNNINWLKKWLSYHKLDEDKYEKI